jgi:prepilin signal peptidase PulO-like enzyme (type II secretory pathway)
VSNWERVLALLLLGGLLWLGLWWPAGADTSLSTNRELDQVVVSVSEFFASGGQGGKTVILFAVVGLFFGTLLNWSGDYLRRFSAAGAASPPGSDTQLVPAWWRSAMWREWDWLGIAIESLTALLFAYLWARYGPSWRLLELTFYTSIFLLITLTDLRHRLVLNIVFYPAIPLTLLIRLLSSHSVVPSTLLGGAAGLALFMVVMLVGRGALGAGDVKLAALIGVVVGFPEVLWALALGIVAGGIGALLILITRRGGLKSYMPYAPFLCLGAMLVLLYYPPLLPVGG